MKNRTLPVKHKQRMIDFIKLNGDVQRYLVALELRKKAKEFHEEITLKTAFDYVNLAIKDGIVKKIGLNISLGDCCGIQHRI